MRGLEPQRGTACDILAPAVALAGCQVPLPVPKNVTESHSWDKFQYPDRARGAVHVGMLTSWQASKLAANGSGQCAANQQEESHQDG